jgi:hypothetical protein
MSNMNRRLLFGGLIILAGILFLLQNLRVFVLPSLFWGVLFAGAGLVFMYFLLENRANWWTAIPGCILIGLAGTIVVSDIPAASHLSGSIFLLAIALSFVLVYLVNRSNWWAIIPGGIMVTLAVVAGLPSGDDRSGMISGGILFLGMAATFGLLGLLPGTRLMKWPFIPAAILALIGLLILTTSSHLFNYIWPVALVLVGLYLLLRSALKR